VLIDGRLHWFVAHLVARKGWWRGRIYAAMNAQYLGRWDVAPRGHPNDGVLDTYDVTMSAGERLKARSRLVAGAHLPHPDIKEQRVRAAQVDVAGLDVWLDGERLGPARSLSIRIEPDALLCVV
jgi:diacylglycerol kinase family enzyme